MQLPRRETRRIRASPRRHARHEEGRKRPDRPQQQTQNTRVNLPMWPNVKDLGFIFVLCQHFLTFCVNIFCISISTFRFFFPLIQHPKFILDQRKVVLYVKLV